MSTSRLTQEFEFHKKKTKKKNQIHQAAEDMKELEVEKEIIEKKG